jgi:hypothetical protein
LACQAGNLYATWDTQTRRGDIGWLAYSPDHGKTWSALIRVTPGHTTAASAAGLSGSRNRAV